MAWAHSSQETLESHSWVLKLKFLILSVLPVNYARDSFEGQLPWVTLLQKQSPLCRGV